MRPALRIVAPHRGRPRTDGLRDRILVVAERVFSERPFHTVRMDEVARRSGVAKGTLYLYFPGKRELYLAVLFEGMERLRRRLESVAAVSAAPLDRLRATVAGLLEHPSRRRELLALLLRYEQRLTRDEARQWLRRRGRLSQTVQSVIAEAIAAGALRSVDLKVGEEMLLGIVRGLRAAPRQGASATQLARGAIELLLRGLGADPRRRSRRPPRRIR
jgi:AcrR family transcriptional regulator